MSHPHSRWPFAALGVALLTQASVAGSAVTEPNGAVVPNLAPDPTYTERTLADYFAEVGEFASVTEAKTQVVDLASPEPGQFSPLCSFEAELVLSVSNARAGIAWYNSPTHPTAAPPAADLHHILAPSNVPGASISAADIRSDPAYQGGYIGFALTKEFDSDPATPPTAIYYSEHQRNVHCTNCATPGPWIAALAYRSSLRSDTYYLAFEDWEGASTSPTSWSNDGDFNDKVFKLVGISCAGGGMPCETGGLGLCGKGLTECSLDGSAPLCRAQYTAKQEVCDAVDNDCNGQTDEGDRLCPPEHRCVRGTCVATCSSGEFECPGALECSADGFCVEAACVDVVCEAGLVCRGGACVNACSDVVCPLRQTCLDGVCLDLCAGVVCGTGSVCQDGVCIGTCGCTPCTSGQVCDVASGYCVDAGCEGQSCAAGMVCQAGACVDACAVAKCPGGAPCVNGSCGTPPGMGGGGSGSGGGLAVGGGIAIGTGGVGGGASGGSGALQAPSADSGCGCRSGASPSPVRGWAALVALAAALVTRRWRRGFAPSPSPARHLRIDTHLSRPRHRGSTGRGRPLPSRG